MLLLGRVTCGFCLRARMSSMQNAMKATHRHSSTLQSYLPPAWAKDLKGIPKYRIELALHNTPIHDWKLPRVAAEYCIAIKRDDMTGITMSGNKARKLEFLMADAISQGCKHVITFGGIQSNHTRATAVAATQLGLQSHLVLRSNIQNPDDLGCEGNLFLDRMMGSHLYLCPTPRKNQYVTELKPRMTKIAETIKAEKGEDSYLIPIGGSTSVGVFGYIQAFEELISQGVLDNFDDIFFACGSGGTAAGLSIANYLTGAKLRIHAVIVCDNAKYFHSHINEMLTALGVTGVQSEDILDVIEEYKGEGYGISTPGELDFIIEVSRTTGIILDPTYSGKAVYGFVQELNKNPKRFKGNRILYIHTGGLFGLMDGRMDALLKKMEETNQVKVWTDKDKEPV